MSRKILFLFTILFIISAIAAPVYANQTVFGPKDLKIGRWHVHLSLHRFTVDDPSDGVLTITKNTPDKKIRGGFCFLNGKYIGLRNFLKGTGAFFEKDVNLRSNNRLKVFLRGTPGALIKIEIKKKGVTPPPEVTFAAAPQTITLGESSTLTWTSTDADTCVIEPGIGTIDVNGSHSVSPTATTTYTITATGQGGTATESVTVTVLQPPTVSISADPVSIQAGESSTLTWSSIHADSATIDQDVGTVDVNGSVTVSPTVTTTYTITATGAGGTSAADVTVTVISPITLTITSPSAGDTIAKPDILVKGAVSNTTGNETGIVVNGIPAMVYGSEFAANHVPLQEGENTITATATDTDGNFATASITINAITTGDYIRITADDESGVSGATAFETTLRIDGSFSFTESSVADTGPGVVEFLSSSAEKYSIRITTQGIYYFTAEVTDDQSNTFTDTIAVLVLDEAELDALLRAKWEGMRQALAQSDVDSAVVNFSDYSKDAYKETFTNILSILSQIAQDLDDIQFVKMTKNSVGYDIRAIRNGTEYSFYLLFIKDDKGLWKIKSF